MEDLQSQLKGLTCLPLCAAGAFSEVVNKKTRQKKQVGSFFLQNFFKLTDTQLLEKTITLPGVHRKRRNGIKRRLKLRRSGVPLEVDSRAIVAEQTGPMAENGEGTIGPQEVRQPAQGPQ